MKLHRFYIGEEFDLDNKVWVHDRRLMNQWMRVLRYRPGSELVLFDGKREKLYKVGVIERESVCLESITEMAPHFPARDVYLLWSLIKSDKNDFVIQKCTEIGINHFVPIISDRTEKTGFDEDRAMKIAIEAAEQCGRGNIPAVRSPISLAVAINEFNDKIKLYVADKGRSQPISSKAGIGYYEKSAIETDPSEIEKSLGVLIGPEGGWSEAEKNLFENHTMPHIGLGEFTLRSETAAIIAAEKLLNW